MTFQNVAIGIILLILAWRGLHYIFLWMESKGWIYYKNKPSGSGVGNALQEMNSFMNPSVREVLERKYEQKSEEKKDDGSEGSNQAKIHQKT